MNIMVAGNITSPTEQLKKTDLERLYHSLVNPKPDIAAKIRQLRIVSRISPDNYAAGKRLLPYFVCATFNPPFRRTENFAHTESFILDIDRLSSKQIDPATLKARISRDERVMLCFLSPSGDGLKILFRLKERCYDAGLYSIFYKAFAHDFSKAYRLDQVVDARTSDVTRACFISADAETFYNPFATPVDIKTYADVDNPDMTLGQMHANNKSAPPSTPTPKRPSSDPDATIMARIKQQLKLKPARQEDPRTVCVPEQLNDIIDDLCRYITQTGLVVKEVKNIQYAKQIRVTMNQKQAEVNLFYGRRGFSVVKSTKSGTNAELNEVVADLVKGFVDTY